jgi:hypothetical protein
MNPLALTLARTLAALCLAASSVAVHAIELHVSITSDFDLPPLSAGPGTLALDFDLSEPLSGVTPQADFAFLLSDITVNAIFNGTLATSTTNQVGWFAYADSNYFGIDLRLQNLLVPGDLLQFIFTSPESLFSGTTAAPKLDRLSLSALSGGLYHYPTGVGGFTAEGPLSNATYRVSAVPEPTVAWLLPIGLLLIAGLQRRRMRDAQAVAA